ncbi:MAG TPA: dihydrolipoamide acetyltransferase family protein [Solirubrobacteraceae bacterium]|jgi:pyruvate dehydrogenase E2 component (dihydrolipoamide acetyltransferase)|nr:dihydrolipoamide acetyltransferase family protein [Solirubrobacteraceae bacterium]
MAEIVMPRLSDSMTEGTIVRWLKADGDEVQRGEEIVEVETDKATVGYEAEMSGTLAIRQPEGATVTVGAVIAVLGDVGDAGDAPEAAVGTPETAVAAPEAVVTAPGAARVRASPLARRLARDLGVELSALQGSGPHGRVIKSDVMAAAGNGGDGSHEPGLAAAPEPTASGGELQQLTRTQRLIARRMAEARGTVPEFALEVEVDMTGALEMRRELSALTAPGPSLNDIIVKACGLALRRHPRANGSFADDRFVLHPQVNVAVAVAVEGSLLTPVVRDADARSVGEIARETRRLIERARAGRLSPSELDGGTFTVSNLGMFGIDRFEGIINAPQAAILCVGAVRDRPVARDGAVVIRPLAWLTLAADHRILYGAEAAAFLVDVQRFLERPLTMSL